MTLDGLHTGLTIVLGIIVLVQNGIPLARWIKGKVGEVKSLK